MSHIGPKGENISFGQEIDGRTDRMITVERPQSWALIILNDINYKTSIQIQINEVRLHSRRSFYLRCDEQIHFC